MRPFRRRWRWSPMRIVRRGSGRRCSAARKWRWCRTRRCRETRGVVSRRRSRRPPRRLRVRHARPVPAGVQAREAPTRSTMRAQPAATPRDRPEAGGEADLAAVAPRAARRAAGRGFRSLANRRHFGARRWLGRSGVARGQRAGQDRVAGEAGRGKSGDAADSRRAAALRGRP